MMKKTHLLLILAMVASAGLQAQLLPRLGGQRAGISALTFLKIDPSPRSAAMASANVSTMGDAYSTFTNPAGLADVDKFSIAASNTFWPAGINYAFFSAIKPTRVGFFGLSAASLTTGKMERRTEFQPDGTGQYFSASNTAIGLTYSQRLTDYFSYGVTLKYVNEQLAEYMAHTGVVDLGFLYRTDWKDLSFAVAMMAFGTNSKLNGSYQPDLLNSKPVTLGSYPAPTLFKLGVSMVPWKRDDMSLTTIVQLNHPNDNAENIRIGLEYEYKKLLYLRAGYKINVDDEVYPTAGVGIRAHIGKHPLHIDYAVDPTRYLGWIHRVGLSFGFNKLDREKKNEEAAPAPAN
ncbi:MAG: PorV/PorQ family protein [Bacteroidia bacterium]